AVARPASLLYASIPGGGHRNDPGNASTRPCCHCVDIQLRHVYSVLPNPTSCLKVARKGSRSDFRNRILRPITRRWGICFRSTQRYTVCALTPRYLDASFTDRGRSSDG